MKKLTGSILLLSCLFFNGLTALTFIDQNGNMHQSEPSRKESVRKAPTSKSYYDSSGKYQGRSEKRNYSNRTDHYDSLGRSEGYSERNRFSYDGEVSHYDSRGRYMGSTRER